MNRLPKSKEEIDLFKSHFRQTQGKVNAFRDLFKSYLEQYPHAKPRNEELLTNEQRIIYEKFREINIKQRLFSDSIILYISVADNPNHSPISSLNALFSAMAYVFIYLQSLEVVCRGGIEIGVGWEFYKDEIYGPALYQAYRLENEVAQFPRIVIGNELVKYISLFKTRKISTITDDNSINFANHCNSWIFNDIDGNYALDYLGPSALAQYSPDTKMKIKKSYEFIENEWHRFQKEKNFKLAERYYLLRDYFLKRMPKG